jgi:hypothetical protein
MNTMYFSTSNTYGIFGYKSLAFLGWIGSPHYVEIYEQAEAHARPTTQARMALCDAIADHRDY